jgi:hypothetical protein
MESKEGKNCKGREVNPGRRLKRIRASENGTMLYPHLLTIYPN